MADKQEFLADQRAFYGEQGLRICPRCNGRGMFVGCGGTSRCNDCVGAGVVHENGETVD